MKISQTLITVILTVLLIAAIAWALMERQSKEVEKATRTTEAVLKDPTAPLVDRFKDSLKQNHAVFNNTDNVVNGKVVAVSKELIDTIAKASNIKPSQITNWQQVATTTEAKLLKAERAVDSLRRVTYFYKDQYVRLGYTPGNPADTTDRGTFDFSYNAVLSNTEYKTGGKIFGLQVFQPKIYTDIYSNDPRTTINGYRTFRVYKETTPYGLSLDAVGRYTFGNKREGEAKQDPTAEVGLGLKFNAGRTTFTGDSYFNPKTSAFTHQVGTRISIFK